MDEPVIPPDSYLEFCKRPGPVVIGPDMFLVLPRGKKSSGSEYLFSPTRIKDAWNQCWMLLRELIKNGRCDRVVALCGLPASGKSTWVRKYAHIYKDRTVFFDDLFLDERRRAMWWSNFRENIAKPIRVEIVIITVDRFEIVLQNLARRVASGGHAVPEFVLRKFRDEFRPPKLTEGFQRVSLFVNTYDDQGGAEAHGSRGDPKQVLQPALVSCLVDLCRQRPAAPVEWLAARLREYNASHPRGVASLGAGADGFVLKEVFDRCAPPRAFASRSAGALLGGETATAWCATGAAVDQPGAPPSGASSAGQRPGSGADGLESRTSVSLGLSIPDLSSQAKLPRHERPPEAQFQSLIKEGRVVVCEYHGPYTLGAFHSNVTGRHFGYVSAAIFGRHLAEIEQSMRVQKGWDQLDVKVPGFNPEFAFNKGRIHQGSDAGKRFDMEKVRPLVEKSQHDMRENYKRAVENERNQSSQTQAIFRELESGPEFDDAVFRERLPGGKATHKSVTDMISLYEGALRSIGPLWDVSIELRIAADDPHAELIWSLKKPQRIRYKLFTKYDGDCRKVTDCARTSLVFSTIGSLKKAAQHLLARPTTVGFKNRFAHPTAECYSDMLFLVDIGGYVCEVQLHLRQMANAKSAEDGHMMYKLCRLVLATPSVKEDTYCAGIVDNRPHGEGAKDAQGLPDGSGTMIFASGCVYKGEWKAGQKHGYGWQREATGAIYEGSFEDGQFNGEGRLRFAMGGGYQGQWRYDKSHGKGTITFPDGNVFEGEFVYNEKVGRGKLTYANGDVFEGKYLYTTEGPGKTHHADGRVSIFWYEANYPTGEGVIFSADGQHAQLMENGEFVKEISFDEGKRVESTLFDPNYPYID